MRTRVVSVLALLGFLILRSGNLLAQAPLPTPDENPEGNTGALKAQVDTGGSYDAHSGNATRIVNDLHVPGALGAYGLDFTRYWNSVHNDDTNIAAEWPTDFGYTGWSHSWRWAAVYDEEWPEGENAPPVRTYVTSITVTFPDGHASKFKVSRTNAPIAPWGSDGRVGPPYYAAHHEDDWGTPGPGAHDTLAEMTQDGSEFWLYRADGGTIHFVGTNGPNPTGGYFRWEYRATELYDSHGLRTELVYQEGLLTQVKQEGNRWLNIGWKTFPNYSAPVIGKVETGGDAGSQQVIYKYGILAGSYVLVAVSYSDTPAPGQTSSAIYTYGFSYQGDQPGAGPQSLFPLLKRADDPHYAGAMTKIFYNYYGQACPTLSQNPANPLPMGFYDWFYFTPEAITEERSDGASGAIVSRFAPECHTGVRKDYNGLGGWRHFYFGRSANDTEMLGILGYQLTKATDFAQENTVPSDLPFRKQNGPEPSKVWDARGIRTDLTYDDSGGAASIHYVDGSNAYNDRIDQGSTSGSLAPDPIRMRNKQHHWLFHKTDENGNTITFRRDERRRVTDIYYPGGSSEHYTYNEWNQMTTHTLPSGAIQHFEYDAYHRLQRQDNSIDIAINASDFTSYTYYGPGNHPEWTGLVEMVIDGRARISGAPFTTRMTYNGRQQVMTLEHASTTGIYPTVRYEYDKYGNRTATTDELGHRKDFTYDSYRRCTSATEQIGLSGTGCGGVQVRRWDWIYDRVIEYASGNQGSYVPSAHTSKEWRIQIEPAFNAVGWRRATARTFDVNNRMMSEQTGLYQIPGEPPDAFHTEHAETHRVTYDPNGQKSTSTDTLGRVTSYSYNNRNRLETTTEPKRQDQTNYPVTHFLYDAAGNKKRVTFPDSTFQRWENYDAFGQAWQFFDENNNQTDLIYEWGPMKKLYQVTTHRTKDSGGTENQPTTFTYDKTGRLTQTLFPDGSTEETIYEFGQLKKYTTRKGQKKMVDVYDARGREKHHYWLTPQNTIDSQTPAISQDWDDAGRLTRISNIFSIIDYTYDDAGQVRTEGTTVNGSAGLSEVRYCRYPNGDVSRITYPNGTVVDRNYTPRGQLESVGWGAGAMSYVYLRDGKIDFQARTNHVDTKFEYDGRGVIKSVRHKNTDSNRDLAYREYWRDDRDRIRAWKRGTDQYYNGMEDGRGNRYGYDAEGQLWTATYRAFNPDSSNPTGALRADTFAYDQLGNRKGWNYVADRGAWMNIARRDNGLNQYLQWENDHPAPDPHHWGSGIFYDDNFNLPSPTPSPLPPGNGVMAADGYITASYNALNQPVGMWSMVYNGTNNFMWFGYDPLGRCVKRWKGPASAGTPGYPTATYFYYDGSNMIQEGPNSSSADRVYVHGGGVDEIVASQVSGLWYNHHYDGQGNCILLSTSSGGLQEQYDYDAFGYPYFYTPSGGKGGSVKTRFLFTGREWISDLRIYDYRARMYQPELGRFLQPDPKEFEAGDYNLYRYCHNDPVNKSDPTGLDGLTMMGKGEWDWDNGRVAMAQIALQQPAQTAKQGFSNAIKGFEKDQNRGKEISPQQVIDAGVHDGREAERQVRGDLRRNDHTKRKYGVERGYSRFVNGKRLETGGPAVGPNNEYEPTVPLPTRPNSGANLGPRFMGIHAHGPQSRRGFDYKDIPLGEGKFGNTPYISVVTSTLDEGKDVHFNVPGYGTWSTSDGGATFRAGE